MSLEILGRAFASTAGVLANVLPSQLDQPTPCTAWRVRDLVNHIVGGAYFFAMTVESGESPAPPDGGAPDFTAGDMNGAFTAGTARALAAFGAEGAMDATVRLPFGELPVPRFMFIAATDAFVHGWDLAKATGQPSDLDPDLASSLLAAARASVPESFRGPDGQAPFGPEVPLPDSACPADRLAAFLGRHP